MAGAGPAGILDGGRDETFVAHSHFRCYYRCSHCSNVAYDAVVAFAFDPLAREYIPVDPFHQVMIVINHFVTNDEREYDGSMVFDDNAYRPENHYVACRSYFGRSWEVNLLDHRRISHLQVKRGMDRNSYRQMGMVSVFSLVCCY